MLLTRSISQHSCAWCTLANTASTSHPAAATMAADDLPMRCTSPFPWLAAGFGLAGSSTLVENESATKVRSSVYPVASLQS